MVLTEVQALGHWEYEDEHRIFHRIVNPDERGYCYINFEDDSQLKEVIVGARCERTVRQVASQVKGRPKAVKVWQVRPAFRTFTMVLQKRVTPITVLATVGIQLVLTLELQVKGLVAQAMPNHCE